MFKFFKKYPQYFALAVGLFISACAGLTNKSLEKGGESQFQAKSSAKPVDFDLEPENLNVSIDGKIYAPEAEEKISPLDINRGVIESFNGDINSWWTGEGGRYTVQLEGGALKVIAKKVGPNYDAFGTPLNGYDFSGGIAIKVRARSEGEKSPILRMDFKDGNGYVSNSKPITNRIVASEEFSDYYFRFDHKLKQMYPTEHALDAKVIKEMLFFLNPGSSSYTGTLYIDEVKAVSVAEAIANTKVVTVIGSEGGMIDDFSDGITTWWCSGNEKSDSPDGKVFRVTANKVGPAYDAFGRSFDPINFNIASTIRVRAKVESDEVPNVRIDIKDPNGYATNAKPNFVKFDKGDVWTDYYFPYKGRFTQTWPNYKKVDPTQIVELLFMVNGGKSPWSGKLYIQEVEAIKPLAETVNQATSATGKIIDPSPSTLPGVVIDNFEEGVDSWWMGSDKYTLNGINDKIMHVACKDIGSGYETFGKGFSPQDFTKTPIVVVRALVDGDQTPNVRADVKDSDGHVANVSPIIQPFKNDGKFNNYFYDFRGKFSQVYPDVQTMNPSQVQEVLFFINPGGTNMNTNIYFEDIKALTPEEYENAIK